MAPTPPRTTDLQWTPGRGQNDHGHGKEGEDGSFAEAAGLVHGLMEKIVCTRCVVSILLCSDINGSSRKVF